MNDQNSHNQQEINNAADRVANQIAKEKKADRKHLLQIEIAKTTDRSTKKELQQMLYEIEDQERKNKRNVIIFFIFLLLIAAISYPLIIKPLFINRSTGNNVAAIYSSSEPTAADSTNIKVNSEETTSKPSMTDSSNTTSESTEVSSEVANEVIDTKNLTTDQVEQWVRAVMDKKYINMTNKINYGVEVTVGEDGLVYITVTPPADLQVDTLDNFRINNNGVLEESGYYYGKPGEWIPVSDQFLDTSKIEPTVSSTSNSTQNMSATNSTISSFDSALEYLKANKNAWSYSKENADTIEIISVNVNDQELKTDDQGSYYSVVINTNDDDGSVTGGGKQFRVYTNGMIKQRAGMHDFYTILN